MDVDFLMVFKSAHQLLGVLQRLLEGVGVCPGEESRIGLLVKVGEGVRELDLKVAFIVPGERTLTTLPFHRVWADSVDGPQAHLVKLSLCGHAFYVKSQSLSILDSFDTEVKPCVIVAPGCVRQGITRHVTGEGVWRSIFCRIAFAEIARVKLA